jgi:hypothetical protein
MVCIGIPVPAAAESTNGVKIRGDNCDNKMSQCFQTHVDFFDPILGDIGDLQSVGSDLSTFSGHMLVCCEVLSTAGQNALLLMDKLPYLILIFEHLEV